MTTVPNKILILVTEQLILVDESVAIVKEDLVVSLPPKPVSVPASSLMRANAGSWQWAAHPLATPALLPTHHVGVGSVLQQCQCEGGNKVEILGWASILDHVHEWEQNMMGALGEADIGIQPVLQQQSQQVADELECLSLLLLPGQWYVFSSGEHEDMQRGQVGLGAAVGVGSVLTQYADTVQITNLG